MQNQLARNEILCQVGFQPHRDSFFPATDLVFHHMVLYLQRRCPLSWVEAIFVKVFYLVLRWWNEYLLAIHLWTAFQVSWQLNWFDDWFSDKKFLEYKHWIIIFHSFSVNIQTSNLVKRMMYQNTTTLVGLWCCFLVVSESVYSFMGLPNQFFITPTETDIQRIQLCQTMNYHKYQSIYQCFIGVSIEHHCLIWML